MIIPEDAIQRWRDILQEIERRLSDPTIARVQIRELKAIRAKMSFLGPGFLVSVEGDIDRLRGMFDKDFL